ncbi:MAG: cell division protein FtsL [Treponema sp.]|nr:cell division protein FtsL [Treponema sp.]
MNKSCIILYFFVLTIPIFLGVVAWQSTRYAALERNVRLLEAAQEDWVEGNRRLIASIAVLSSSARIGQVAARDLRLTPIRPENVLQVRIEPQSYSEVDRQ